MENIEVRLTLINEDGQHITGGMKLSQYEEMKKLHGVNMFEQFVQVSLDELAKRKK